MGNSLKTIDNWFKNHAITSPNKVALNFNNETWTYQNFDNYITKLSYKLVNDFDVKFGNRISYYGTNSNIEVALFFACARLGLIAVPLNWRLSAHELNEIVIDCNPAVIFYQKRFESEVAIVNKGLDCKLVDIDLFKKNLDTAPVRNVCLPYKTSLNDPLFIVYTSGTTGLPKGVVLTQKAVQENAVISVDAHDFTPKDHILNVLPLFHVGGINIQMLPCFFIGAKVTLCEVFDPDFAINKLQKAKITSMVCVPTIISAISDKVDWNAQLFPELRVLAIGSTDVPLEIIKNSHRRGIPMIQIYGATETGPVTTYQKPNQAFSSEGSIGWNGKNVQIKLMSENGNEVAMNTPGEIWVKAPNNFSYYWNNPSETQKALSNGWFKTGDLALKDQSGLYWFTDRLKHIIISGGENIYPAEIERIVNCIPEVKECAVVGRKEPKWGEVPVAFVVLSDPKINSEDILNTLSGKVAKFKTPKDLVILDALPRNAMGKVLVEKLKSLTEK